MKLLDRRLLKLEEQSRKTSTPAIRLFWDEELMACASHANCGIEHASGAHHSPLIRLSFGDGGHE